jgi:hypothetical protein
MLNKKSNHASANSSGNKAGEFDVVCSWCGEVIRANAGATEEQMCLICHARMLNDYFRRLQRVSDERRISRRF